MPNVICTPHLGAATNEAQENVALQVAEQMSDYLLKGAISNAVNFPNRSAAEEAPRLKPWVKLAEQLGSFAGQITENPHQRRARRVCRRGGDAEHQAAHATALVAGLMRPSLSDVNMVSAAVGAKEHGIVVEEVRTRRPGRLPDLYPPDGQDRQVGTLGRRHSVLGWTPARHPGQATSTWSRSFIRTCSIVTNKDKPGFIGRFGTVMGEAGVNIARINLGRDQEGGNAIALVAIDQPPSDETIKKIEALPNVGRVHRLAF